MEEKEQLDRLLLLGTDLNAVQDFDILMERILTEARRFVRADAGSIYIREDAELRFAYTQNETLQSQLAAGEKLLYTIFRIPIDDSSIAGYTAFHNTSLCFADVYQIPEDAPYHFSRKFDVATSYRTRSMQTLPLADRNGEVMGVLQIINPRDSAGNVIPFTKEGIRVLHHFSNMASVALERAKLTRSILLRMIQMAQMRDPKETGTHVNRVGGYAVELYEAWARRRNIPEPEIDRERDRLRMAAMLHDVGKVAIPDSILKKPGRFEKEEFAVMKQHTLHGARLFQDQNSDFESAAAEVALNHHEWWDGTGYPGHVDIASGNPLPGKTDVCGNPLGKKEEEIPLFGRIVALADVYDALTTSRIYKPAWDEERVLSIIREGAGTQFDPELVEIFFGILDVIRQVQERFQNPDIRPLNPLHPQNQKPQMVP